MICFFAVPAFADWDLGDGHKMHFPQLPNPDGWDVEFFRVPIADDWMCSQSGPVTDIHFWTSWAQDDIGLIGSLTVSIYKDVPNPNPGSFDTFSHPGDLIVSRVYDATQFTVRPYGQGDQGFYDPDGSWALHDHQLFQQINIVDEVNPLFYQEEGTIYWLAISADWENINQSPIGWKTSLDHFNDAAVYWSDDGVSAGWRPLYDPALGEQGIIEPLDLAFVITPEPATMLLLALGSVALLKKK